jgi:hypothetical protein
MSLGKMNPWKKSNMCVQKGRRLTIIDQPSNRPIPMRNQIRITAGLLLAMFLLGCGQSGDLYVAGNPSTIQPAATSSSAEGEKDTDESDSQ